MVKKQITRAEIDNKYKWDLTTIYASDDAFYQEYEEIKKKIDNLNVDGVLDNAKNLYNYLKDTEALEVIIDKLYSYAHLNNDADTTVSKYDEMTEKVIDLYNLMAKKTSFFEPNLLKKDYSLIEQYYLDYPQLREYEILLKNIFRYKSHSLEPSEERIVVELSKSLSASSDTYEKLTDTDLTFGIITDEKGNKVELTESNYALFLRSKNRTLRKNAFKKLLNKYKEFVHAIASTYSGYINTKNALSNIYKYKNPLEMSLYHDDISEETYNTLIDTVHENMKTIFKYYKVRNKVLGYKEHLYDTYLETVDFEVKYTFDEAKKIVLDALSVMGENYISVLNKAFNESWIDIYNNKGKRGGAYSSGSYLTNPFILLNFEGKFNDVSTLAHELGHSVHSYYSNKNNTCTYSGYPIFVAEIASTVNEMLLANYFLKNGDKNTKKLVLNNLLELFKSTIYRQTMFAEFERNMTLDSKNGIVLTSDYLVNSYYELVKQYFGSSVIIDEEIKYEWARIPHFYYDFYVYKYATGLSIASFIATEISDGNKELLNKYLDFLKIGSKMNPRDALLTLGIDITKKDFIEKAIKLFDKYIDEYENI